MRIMILSPRALPAVTGNAITAERWRCGLVDRGCHVQVLATQGLTARGLQTAIDRFRPDLLHAHHVFLAGACLCDLPLMNAGKSIPAVVSPAGTDINQPLPGGPESEVVLRVLNATRAIVAQSKATLQRLQDILPQSSQRIFEVPKSVHWFGDEDSRLRELAGCLPGDILFFLPAGVRPVKGNLACLQALAKLREHRPQIRAVFAGPDLDASYAARFAAEIRRCASFARWIRLIPPAAMRSAYAAADVVLNASSSEGLANALLEAMAAGKPLLAADIPGNRGPVLGEDGDSPAGLLFNPHDPEDFLRQALRLIDDGALRRRLGQAGQDRAARCPHPGQEAEGLMGAYEYALRRS